MVRPAPATPLLLSTGRSKSENFSYRSHHSPFGPREKWAVVVSCLALFRLFSICSTQFQSGVCAASAPPNLFSIPVKRLSVCTTNLVRHIGKKLLSTLLQL